MSSPVSRCPRPRRSQLAKELVDHPEALDELVPAVPDEWKYMVPSSAEALELLDKIRPARYALMAIFSHAIAIECGASAGSLEVPPVTQRRLMSPAGHDFQAVISSCLHTSYRRVMAQVPRSEFAPHLKRLDHLSNVNINLKQYFAFEVNDRPSGLGSQVIRSNLDTGSKVTDVVLSTIRHLAEPMGVPRQEWAAASLASMPIVHRLASVKFDQFKALLHFGMFDEARIGDTQRLVFAPNVVRLAEDNSGLRLEFVDRLMDFPVGSQGLLREVKTPFGLDKCPAMVSLGGKAAIASTDFEAGSVALVDQRVDHSLVSGTFLGGIELANGTLWPKVQLSRDQSPVTPPIRELNGDPVGSRFGLL